MSDNELPRPSIAAPDSTPCITEREAQSIAKTHFNVVGAASALPSERDQNFLLTCANGEKYVMKLANAEEDQAVLEFQAGALDRAKLCDTPLEVPSIVPATDGSRLLRIRTESGESYLTRLVTWVEGEMMADLTEHSPELLTSIGDQMARLDYALLDYRHPGMNRALCWDVKYAKGALEYLTLLSPERQHIVKTLIAPALALDWSRLKESVIHSDANDYNLLVRDGRASGLIDFGDMVYSALAAEPAIAAAYAMLGKARPLDAAAHLVKAYLLRMPLAPYDRDAILPLATARLCMSVCFAAHNANAKPDDPYQLVTAEPAWDVLEHLAKASWAELKEQWDGLIGDKRAQETSVEELLAARRRLMGANLSVSYKRPLNIVRGEGAYLIDQAGRAYLDCVNNVCHVGHCHPRVVEAGVAQMRVLNTNTRYLNRFLTDYAECLTATLPAPLNVAFFANSGSEANELALRLARCHTGRKDVAVLDVAYHGTTACLIDISPYKHAGPGGAGRPSWVHVAPMPDPYRGLHRGAGAGVAYADELGAVLMQSRDGVAAFIAESALGCGGQIILPDGFLKAAYAHARDVGAVCIADEVQTGMGRAGSHFWMFEMQDVVPDIVTVGKPIGNGHPMAAVVTTREIADSFANGMEYFNTFGGNPVSCAIGLAVLDVIEEENLQAHALQTGEQLKQALKEMADRQPLIGDVRGQGLFLGVELVRNHETLEPADAEADAIVNQLRERGVLLSTDGPHHNVLKIKPPIVFPTDEVSRVVDEIEAAMTRL